MNLLTMKFIYKRTSEPENIFDSSFSYLYTGTLTQATIDAAVKQFRESQENSDDIQMYNE
jgi:hypothetical protein